MIRIYKDKDNKCVTKGAYETFYKPLGYKIVLDIKPQKVEEKNEKVQLDEEVRTVKRTKGRSTKKNKEGEQDVVQDR